MEIILAISRAIVGVALGFTIGRSRVGLAGSLMSGLIGDTCVLSYAVTVMMLSVGPNLASTGSAYTEIEVNQAMRSRALFLVLGLVFGTGAACIGWRGVTMPVAIAICFIVMLCRFQGNLVFWATIALLVIVSKLAVSVGAVGVPLAGMLYLSNLPSRRIASVRHHVDVNALGSDPGEWLLGVAAGVIPALNTGALSESRSALWTIAAIGEGFALALSLGQRDVSKTTLTAMLLQFAPEIDPIGALLTIGLVITFCIVPGGPSRLCGQEVIVPKIAELGINIGALAWYIAIPDAPLLTYIICGSGYLLLEYLMKLPRFLPYKFQSGLMGALILTL